MNRLLIMVVQDYLAGDASLDRLQQLLIDFIWDKRAEITADTLELARNLDLSIAEFTNGDISVDQLKTLLRELAGLNSYVLNAVGVSSAQASPQWRSAAQTEKRKVVFG